MQLDQNLKLVLHSVPTNVNEPIQTNRPNLTNSNQRI